MARYNRRGGKMGNWIEIWLWEIWIFIGIWVLLLDQHDWVFERRAQNATDTFGPLSSALLCGVISGSNSSYQFVTTNWIIRDRSNANATRRLHFLVCAVADEDFVDSQKWQLIAISFVGNATVNGKRDYVWRIIDCASTFLTRSCTTKLFRIIIYWHAC